MLRWLRHARLDLRTGIVIIALAVLVWGVVAYVGIRDFVPEEMTEPARPPAP